MTSKRYSVSRWVRDAHERKKNLWRNNIILFVALVFAIFIEPVLDLPGIFLSRLTLGTVVIAGIFAADYRKKVFTLLITFGFLVLIAFTADLVLPDSAGIRISAFLLATVSLIVSSIAIVSHVALAERPDGTTIFCALNGYLLIGLTGSILLIINFLVDPGAFPDIQSGGNLSELFYFGFVTLTTLGYGDLSPSTPVARSLSVFIALSGQLYLVINMALLIGKYLNRKNRPE